MWIKKRHPDFDELAYKHSLLDPDYVVEVLEITSAEIISAFPERFNSFIYDEFGEVYDNEEAIREIEEGDFD